MSLDNTSPIGNSILQTLSSASWQRGLANFFIESIPFSFSNGHEYAQFCASIMTSIQKETPLNIVEYGAGLGLFAEKCTHFLEKNKQAYQYTLTDNIALITKQLEQLECVKKNPHIQVKTQDITAPDPQHRPDISILTYVLDTLPTTILYCDNGHLSDCQLKISVKKEATLTNTTVYPFETWTNTDIEIFLNNDIQTEHLPLLSRVMPCLELTWTKTPYHSQDPMLTQWVQNEAPKEPFYFNYSAQVFSVLEGLIQASAPEGLIICHDFAQKTPLQCQNIEDGFGHFGVCTFYSSPFYLIKFWCKQNGHAFYASQYPDCENQMGVICLNQSKQVQEHIQKQLNKEEPGKAIFNATHDIEQCPDSDSVQVLQKTHQNTHGTLACNDYVYQFTCAKKYMELNEFQRALDVIEEILINYASVAMNAIILKSKCHRQLKQYKQAQDCIDQALNNCPNYDLLWLEKAFIQAEMNHLDDCKKSIKTYFSYACYNPQLNLETILHQPTA